MITCPPQSVNRQIDIHGHPTPEQAAMVASWAIYGAAVQWSQQKRREPAQEFVQQVLPMIMAGLEV